MTDPISANPDDAVPFGFKDVARTEKPRLVRGVFDAVASKYDLMNDLMSFGLHRAWKDAAIARLSPQPGQLLIDVAGGTGDLSRGFVAAAEKVRQRRGGDPARAIVTDLTPDMLFAGKARGRDEGLTWVAGDALNLPYPDGAADAAIISFGIRNVADIPRALRELRRILKRGGRFVCLEFSKPTNGVVEAVYDRFSFDVIPRIGQVVAGEAEPYRYLVESIRRHPDQATFAAMMRDAGFGRVEVTNFSGGVCALHAGWAL
jgi:demethylmenaquinone methyltransferase / 2-methoxy-6-polyprenyl-1,4-benzoquinol methylase